MAFLRTSKSRTPQIARTFVETDDDYQMGDNDEQVQVTGNDTDEASVEVSLPCHPRGGEKVLIVACGAPVLINGGDADVVGLAVNPIPQDSAVQLVFCSADVCSCSCDDGKWVAICCPATPPTVPTPQ